MICNRWNVVVVPFPFADKLAARRRPALVLSRESFNNSGYTILSMITTSGHRPWPGDTQLIDYETAGLHLPCIVRFKIFTLDNRLILKNIGHLSRDDRKNIKNQLLKFI